jgi:hypothetical protein
MKKTVIKDELKRILINSDDKKGYCYTIDIMERN